MAARSQAQKNADARSALQMRLSGDPRELATLRAEVGELAAQHGLSERSADVVLALEELVANAQQHGAPPVDVAIWADGRLMIEVSDGGSGLGRMAVPDRPPRSDQDHGRGLWIVSQLADHIDVRCSAEGTTVRIELTSEPVIGA